MSDIVTTQIFTDGEKGITATKMNNIVAGSTIQTDFYANKPASSTLDPTDQLLELKSSGSYARITGAQLSSSVAGQLPLATTSQPGMLNTISGNATDFVDGTNHCQNLANAVKTVGIRSYNALGNSTFECDQFNCGATVANPATATRLIDRWFNQKIGTLVASFRQTVGAANEVLVPGSNFAISRNFLRTTITTAEASLATGDNLTLYTQIEGPNFRELQYDVHSVQLLVRSSVAGLKFGLGIRDPGATTKSLTKLGTITSANTWTLVSFPNIPVFPSGNFSTAPGTLGYLLSICLAAGTALTAPANDTWQNGNFIGATGQSNFASATGTFDVAFVQHEPGAVCSTPIDKPFVQNLDECLRYFAKSYDYAVKPGTNSSLGARYMTVQPQNTQYVQGPTPFPKPMAKDPTVNIWSTDGTANAVQISAGANVSVTGAVGNVGQSGFGYMQLASSQSANYQVQFHYSSDTGW